MHRKIFSINLLMAVVFSLTAVFPASLFSYETAGYEAHSDSKGDWVDESLGCKDEGYKKVRCPQCGMEFYYIPGKESPHSNWVHYELSKEELDRIMSDSKEEIDFGNGMEKENEKLLDLFKKNNANGNESLKKLEKQFSKKSKRGNNS